MTASRATLARMLAAATEVHVRSALARVRTTGRPVPPPEASSSVSQSWVPSRSTRSGDGPTCARARAPARRSAPVSPRASISPEVAAPTAVATAQASIRGTSRSREAAASSFESRIPTGGRPVVASRTTSPTWSGPAGEPRPTSSIAPSRATPDRSRCRSMRRVGTAAGRRPVPPASGRPCRLDGPAMAATYSGPRPVHGFIRAGCGRPCPARCGAVRRPPGPDGAACRGPVSRRSGPGGRRVTGRCRRAPPRR